MKLHLPKRLFTALLAVFTLTATPAALTLSSTAWGAEESGEVTGNNSPAQEEVAYSGTVYTYTGVNSGTELAFSILTFENADGNTGQISGVSGAWTSVSNAIATNSNTVKNTLRFDAEATTPRALTYTFNPIKVAGFIVESGATGYSITSQNTYERHIEIGNADSTKAYTTIKEDFSLDNTSDADSHIWLWGNQEWQVASEKTYTLTSGTGGIENKQGGNLTITGGGTVKFGSTFINNGTVTVNAGSRMEAGNVTGNGSLVLNGTGDYTLDGQLSVATLTNSTNLTVTGAASTRNVTNTGKILFSGAYNVGSNTLALESGTAANADAIKFASDVTASNITIGASNNEGSASLGTVSFLDDVNVSGKFYARRADFVFGDGETAGVATLGRIELGDSVTYDTHTGTISNNYTVVVKGNNNTNSYKDASLILGEWNTKTTLNVNGSLLAKDAKMQLGDSGGTLNINNGGTVAVMGISRAKTDKNPAFTLTMSEGGKLVLGSDGLDVGGSGTQSYTLNGGTVGISASAVTINENLIMGGGEVTFDTTQYEFINDGKGIEQGEEGGSLTISGVLSGEGKLVKAGAGTLTLSGANTYSGGTTISNGELKATSASALGTGAISVASGAKLNLEISGTETLSTSITGAGTVTMSGSGTLILSGQGNEIENVTIGAMNLTIAEDTTFTRVTANNSEYTVSLNAGKTMTLNGGTTEGDNVSTISKLTTGSGSTVVLNSGANLTLSSVSGVSGKIIGDGTLTLNTMNTMEGIPALFAGALNELVLTGSGTCLEITGYGQMDEFNNIKNLVIQNGATFSNRLTNRTIGSAEHTLTISGAGAGTTDSVAALAFGRATDSKTDMDMTMSHTVHLADDATVWVENDRKGILTGTVNGADHVLTKTGSGELELQGKVINTSFAVNAGILKLSGTTTTSESVVVNGGTLKLGSNATLTAGDVQISQQNAELSNVTVQGSSITATSTENGAKGSISNALIQLAQDASFTIQDMTLTNTTITAATTETRVNLNNVSGNATLETGTFALQMQAAAPNVGMGGASLSYGVAGTPSLTLGATGAKLVITADPSADVNGIYSDYTLTFNLNVNLTQNVGAWEDLVEFEGWLGKMLVDQGATYHQVADGAAAVSEGASGPSVSYGYSPSGGAGGGANVGTLVITISGLNVPEPTTATLSLLALAALAARRRRK